MSEQAAERETRAINTILTAINHFFTRLPQRLNAVDTPGERKSLERAAERYRDSQDETYYGVFSRHGSDEIIRVSRHGAIHDEESNVLTINYFADEAREYAFDPGPTSPIRYKARVTIRNGQLHEIVEHGDSSITDPGRVRKDRSSGALSDIMETVRREQDELVRVAVRESVVITGGPGTGKTAVGLQRLGYVMYDDRGHIGQRRILVLGPSQAYGKYVSNFLPGLGFRDVLVRSYREFFMEPLFEGQSGLVIDIYEDSRAAVRDKNSRDLERVLFTSVWPENRMGAITVRVTSNQRRPPEVRTLPREEVQEIHDSLRESFWTQEVSYERAREEFLRQLALRLRQEKADPADWSKTPEGRRDALIRSLPDKIGRHSRAAKRYFEKQLVTPQGLNFQRDVVRILQTYYAADVNSALDLLIEQNARDFDAKLTSDKPNELKFSDLLSRRLIEEKLVELDAPLKSTSKPDRRRFAREPRYDLGEFAASELTPDRNSQFGQEVWRYVISVLPNKDAARIARSSVRGENKVFNDIGVKKIEQLGKRLRAYAKSVPKPSRGTEIWSTADLALTYWCNNIVRGSSSRFAHVLLDEAQDLTGIELKAIRSALGDAPVTVAGDLKQSTTFGAISDWQTLMDQLGRASFTRGDLTVNYRVPREIYSYACSYLTDDVDQDRIASEFGGGSVSVRITDQRRDSFTSISDIVRDLSANGLVAVITSEREIEELPIGESNDLLIVSPFDSKGLEVDHLVLVEPTSWYDQSREMRRLMFVALTRATKSVTILQSRRASGRIITPD